MFGTPFYKALQFVTISKITLINTFKTGYFIDTYP